MSVLIFPSILAHDLFEHRLQFYFYTLVVPISNERAEKIAPFGSTGVFHGLRYSRIAVD